MAASWRTCDRHNAPSIPWVLLLPPLVPIKAELRALHAKIELALSWQ
jgi:hypothetical protein